MYINTVCTGNFINTHCSIKKESHKENWKALKHNSYVFMHMHVELRM